MLLDFPKYLWEEAIATSVYLYNRTPHRTIDFKLLFELLNGGSPPSIAHLHTFGKKVYVHIPVENRPSGSKLQPRAVEEIFMGYTNSSNIYRIYIPAKRVVHMTRQVTLPVTKSWGATVEFKQPSISSQIPSSNVEAKPTLTSIRSPTPPSFPIAVPESFAETPCPPLPNSKYAWRIY